MIANGLPSAMKYLLTWFGCPSGFGIGNLTLSFIAVSVIQWLRAVMADHLLRNIDMSWEVGPFLCPSYSTRTRISYKMMNVSCGFGSRWRRGLFNKLIPLKTFSPNGCSSEVGMPFLMADFSPKTKHSPERVNL